MAESTSPNQLFKNHQQHHSLQPQFRHSFSLESSRIGEKNKAFRNSATANVMFESSVFGFLHDCKLNMVITISTINNSINIKAHSRDNIQRGNSNNIANIQTIDGNK